MSPIRLIALDLDGTVVPPGAGVSARVRGAVRRAREAGVPTTIVTGRMLQSARPHAEALGVEGPIICYQGAAIYTVATGERLTHVPLSVELGQRVFARAARDGVRALGFLDDELYAEGIDRYVERYTAISGVRPRIVPSLAKLFASRSSTKIVCVAERENADAYVQSLQQFLGPSGYVTRSFPEYIEVMNPEVNKGRALAAVASQYGVTLTETMGVGDSWNDVPLLDAVGFGVAMGAAPPELLAVADASVADVYHDGAAEAIERFVLCGPAREAAL